ncbi:uncharacterized protein LOC143210720 [Lasioglossum baleicum]|uniref:uncharacterized protein LOC143210720 n=1 Tax=Lasioglossum baleicum TaxID=434251 RepID=UPI003FCE76D2
MQQRTRPEKSPSTQNLMQAEHKEPPQNGAECYIPKTRFTAQDRCKEFATSSSLQPRLKSFPAEKIKKVDNSPAFTADPIGAIIMQQNPQESGTFYVPGSADQNNGQGDATTNLQPASQQRQQQNMHTTSMQQVGNQQSAHQVGQMNPTSDCTLHQQALSNQVHRPCVPHGQQEYPPQKAAQPLYRNAPQNAATPAPPNPMQQPLNVSGLTASPEKSKAESNEAERADYDGQPVGGRNAALYRQTMMTGQQPRAQSHMSMMPNVSQSNSSQQYQLPTQSQASPQSQPPGYTNPQNPQLAYQQLQQTMAQQQLLQQRAMAYQTQMMSNDPRKNQENLYNQGAQLGAQTPAQVPAQVPAQAPVQGMTSPQEAMKNRGLQNFQAQQRGYAMNPQNAHLQPYAINMVNNQPQFVAPCAQQHPMAQYQQQPVQLYRNPEQPLYRNPADHPGHQLYRNPAGNASQQVMDQPGYNEQMSGRQMGQSSQNPAVQTRPDNQQNRTKLPFTPSMIRDQEKMVATMKQQGVPYDIIKRQFESLLNEQHRQLEYIEDIRRQDDMPEVERPATVTRRHRQTDEKPEWMIHLTPPRVPYVQLEKMYEQQKEKERLARPMDQNRQIQQNEMPNRHSEQQYQQYLQDNRQQPLQMFPQPRPIGSVQSSPNMLATNYQQYQPYHQSFPSYQQAQYAHLQQHNPQFQYQQVSRENPRQVESQVHPNNSTAKETAKPTTEPSSLLKLRMYKERIRPQGRNNGLQDPQIVRKYLEKSSESMDVRRGLEYLASLESKTPTAKLNGMQERMEAEHQLNERLLAASSKQVTKRVSANGLENGRNANNPPRQNLAQLKKADHELREYPRQKQSTPANCYVQAERENGTVAADEQPATSYGHQHLGASTPMIPYNEKNPTAARFNVMPFRFDGSCSQHYQQMQQYYQNARNLSRNIGEGDAGPTRKNDLTNKVGFDRAGGDATGNVNGQTLDTKMPIYRTHYSQPDLHEARTFGGVRYLARKQDYMPNTQFLSPETLIASRHLQPPVIY